MNPTLWLVASAVGVAVLVLLAVIYRRAAAQREVELADEAIDAEYASLASPKPPERERRGQTTTRRTAV